MHHFSLVKRNIPPLLDDSTKIQRVEYLSHKTFPDTQGVHNNNPWKKEDLIHRNHKLSLHPLGNVSSGNFNFKTHSSNIKVDRHS